MRRSIGGFIGIAVTTAVVVTAPEPVRAQGRTAIVHGVVTNLNGVRLPNVDVQIVGTDLRAATNDSGVYRFDVVPAIRIRLIARRIGFEPSEERVSLETVSMRQVDFELKGIPEQLDSVMIREAGGNGRMSDFYARRLAGVGFFITYEDIERRRPSRSSDLLRTVAGVKVALGDSGFDRPVIQMGRSPVMSRGRGVSPLGGECSVSYYVDGSYVPPGTFHLDDISPLALEAIEVYRGPAETPARLRQRDTACGVIMVWTRDPSRRSPGQQE